MINILNHIIICIYYNYIQETLNLIINNIIITHNMT